MCWYNLKWNMKIYIINPDKQMNKVVFMFDQLNSFHANRRNATIPIDIKENQMKKRDQIIFSHEFPCCENEHVFMFCISIKLKVRGGGAPFLSYKIEKITEIVIVINSMVIVPYPITSVSKDQIECLFTRQTSRAWLMNHFKMSQKPAEKENAKC